MNKDTVVASIIGFGLGLVAAIALWVVPRILPKLPHLKPPAQQETTATTDSANNNTGLSISSPQDGTISQSDSTTVRGLASNTNLIVISTTEESQVITPAADGAYSASIELAEGNNEIVLSLISSSGTKIERINVFYFADEI